MTEQQSQQLHLLANQFYLDFSQLVITTLEQLQGNGELREELRERLQEKASVYGILDTLKEVEIARQHCPHCMNELNRDWTCSLCICSLEGLRKGEKWLIG